MKDAVKSVAIAAAVLAAASPVYSQAPIVDLSDDSPRQSAPAYPDSSESGYQGRLESTAVARVPPSTRRAQDDPPTGTYYQMQVLQQEVRELRGVVEELRHEVERLKQQRTDDYMDLDRRILRLSGETEQSSLGEDAATGDSGGAASAPPVAASGDERERYHASFGKAREGDYAGASADFKSLLQDYPNGKYAPNANYWLGEIALVQGNLEEARKWFTALLDGYPNSTKVWDGRYKLGTVYYQLGEQQKARELLEQVAGSDARAADLAKKYLEDNF